MTTEAELVEFMSAVDPQVEAQIKFWDAVGALGITGEHAELIKVALRTKDPETIRAGLEAMMHPSAFAERYS